MCLGCCGQRYCGNGVAIKSWSSIRRFQHAVSLLQTGKRASETAQDAGYYDQPHMHRDFRRFAGTSPETLVRQYRETPLTRCFNKPAVSDFYNTLYLA